MTEAISQAIFALGVIEPEEIEARLSQEFGLIDPKQLKQALSDAAELFHVASQEPDLDELRALKLEIHGLALLVMSLARPSHGRSVH